MKKRVVILALAAIMICGAIFTGCSTQTEKEESESSSQSSQPEELESSSEPEESSPESSSFGGGTTIIVVPPSSSSVPEASSSAPSSGEFSSEPASMEQVLALQEYLFDTLPQDSYAYLNAGAQEGFLTIGYTDLDTIKSVVNDYNGSPCPIIYSAAECSVADTLDFLDKINENIDFPGEAYIEPVSDIPGAFEGARLGIHASNDEQAQEIEDEILALAKKTNFPQKYLKFYHMALGYNPDT